MVLHPWLLRPQETPIVRRRLLGDEAVAWEPRVHFHSQRQHLFLSQTSRALLRTLASRPRFLVACGWAQVWLLVVGRVHPLVAAGPPPGLRWPGSELCLAPGPGREAVSVGELGWELHAQAILPARVPGPDPGRGGQARPRQCRLPGHQLPEQRERCVLGLDHRGAAEPHSLEAVDQPLACPRAPFLPCRAAVPPHGLFPQTIHLPLYQGLGAGAGIPDLSTLGRGAGISQG